MELNINWPIFDMYTLLGGVYYNYQGIENFLYSIIL